MLLDQAPPALLDPIQLGLDVGDRPQLLLEQVQPRVAPEGLQQRQAPNPRP